MAELLVREVLDLVLGAPAAAVAGARYCSVTAKRHHGIRSADLHLLYYDLAHDLAGSTTFHQAPSVNQGTCHPTA